MEKNVFKELLIGIKNNDYKVPQGINPYDLTLAMLDYIGDTDSELRDELVLSNLSIWIIEGTLSTSEVYKLLMILLDHNFVLKGIGYVNDSIFGRTFSVEVIAAIIYRHRQENFISQTDIQKAFCTVIKFYKEDRDVRGYIEGKGWAHGAAHGADALDEFAQCDSIGSDGLIKILDAIYNKVNVNYYGYIHLEDERMITVVKSVLGRKIVPENEINVWIRRFSNIEKIGKHPEDQVIESNVNSFLKSLFFRLIDNPMYEQLTCVIRDVIKQTNRFN
jgi:hypothetical protein